MRRIGPVVALGVAAALLSACSQVASLTPVSGASVTTVRNAANVILVEQEVSILVAPTCSAVDAGFTCVGSTVDGEEILVTAGPAKPFDMSVAVGGQVIFEGNATDVLQAAVLEAS